MPRELGSAVPGQQACPMYLVHARLRSDAHAVLPHDAASLLSWCARPDERLEFVVVHGDVPAEPVLGMFLVADSLVAAEAVAAEICRRALRAHASLSGFRLHSCDATLPVDYYDRLLGDSDSGLP
jgi:hypothetical protein